MLLTEFLTREQVETIHRNALRILAEIGVQVEHEEVRERLATIGGQGDGHSGRVRFPVQVTERYLFAAQKRAVELRTPTIRAVSGVFQSYYADPSTDDLLPFNEDRLARYAGLARSLTLVEPVGLLGLPFVPDGIPAQYLPLAEKLYAWKYGMRPDGSIQLSGLCAPLIDVFSCHAEMSGKRLEDVFTAVGYLISPLKLARPECEQWLYFFKLGLRMTIGHLPSQGATAPITLAGSITLMLAEQIFLHLLHRAFWEDGVFRVGGGATTIDMRRGASCYGRPEKQRINLAFADIARFYGCPCDGHTGHSDAKRPSFEAGAQKATGALMTALATGCGTVKVGQLSCDEICSPVQMILDHDLVRGLRALLAEPVVNEAECAFEEILAGCGGGNFLGTDLTAQRFRTELYQPQTWSWQMASGWLQTGKRLDVDIAKDRFREFESRFAPVSQISADEEKELHAIISNAVKVGVAGI